ncbi:hypothetical protein PAXINDRAFT_171670 [Paxillus involutus ATCC 200175]|uniref:DUF6699 domain-containing protein n=1 Tax=Paxillus involutus ATCC 200175 TaxID=664439 RepID=A0A0C9TMC7_PAXIN|nr:hypothetical protein PAXINDRAFT_171670 [Paxillus involutus ATCC 200175]
MDDMWADMPPLVNANNGSGPRSIPPPPGATVFSGGQAPCAAPMPTPQYPWGAALPGNHHAPHPPTPYAAWDQYCSPQAYPHQTMPSPYIPHQPMLAEAQAHDQFALRRAHTLAAAPSSIRKRANSLHGNSPWPSQGDLSPLYDHHARKPDVQAFAPYSAAMHTPSSTLSRSTSSSGYPGVYYERPGHWRRDFKFKSGLASMFRSWSNNSRAVDEFTDSSKLNLHPFLHHDRSNPPTIYDVRRNPLMLVFRDLDRPPLASDMDHSATLPPTRYMRLYHPRLPWYIDITANGTPFISLADLFQQLFAALDKGLSKNDFYNNDLDNEDRQKLTQAYYERCRDNAERMQGVKRVDFLRGKFEFEGLTRGKNGMWRLKTGTAE